RDRTVTGVQTCALPIFAGALVALSGQLWQSSMVLMADTTGLAMTTLSAWAVVRYARGHQFGWLAVATLAVVLALLSRWIYGLVRSEERRVGKECGAGVE